MTNQSHSFHVFSRHIRGCPLSQKKAPMLEPEEETRLVYAMQGRDNETPAQKQRARDKLILAYTPLARRMAHNASIRGVIAREDLQGEAIIALAIAIDKFDPDRGARISTFASFEIRSALMTYVMHNSGPTKLGTNLDDKRIFMNLRSKIRDMELKKGRPIQESDLDEIADEMNVKVKSIKRMMPRIFASDVAVSGTDSVSEDGEGNGSQAIGGLSYIATEGGQEDREVAIDTSRVIRLMEDYTIAKWDGRNREIILAYIRGKSGKKSLNDLACKHSISVERVRQIQRHGREVLKTHLQTAEKIRSLADICL